MDNMYFYPTLTSEMKDSCGLKPEKYVFSYSYDGSTFGLQQKGTSTIKLTDPLDIWDIESEGLNISKTVRIAYPNLLQGPEGVACKNAMLGVCIIWTNRKLTQTGYFLPSSDVTNSRGRTCVFDFQFKPETISGDLELSLVMYIKKQAEVVLPGEEDLVNETGVSVGEIENVNLDFNSIIMQFPIEEYKSEKEPLWWVEFSNWEDPETVDTFSSDNVCLYLNTYYDACPSVSTSGTGSGYKNFDMMVDILAQTYFLMFKKLDDEQLRHTKENIGLSPDTICSILNQFLDSCVYEPHWESDESLLKSLQINIREMLQGDNIQ